MVQLLLSAGADIQAPGGTAWPFNRTPTENPNQTPITQAVRAGRIDMVRFLLSVGAKPDADTMGEAGAGQSTALVQILLNAGADINAQSRYGTPLGRATSGGNVAMVKCLLAAGANPGTAQTSDAATPLHLNTSDNADEIAQLLIAAGADVKARNQHAFTPLHCMALHTPKPACALAAQRLIQNGADIHCLSTFGATPLTWAIFNHDLGMVKILLEAGADTQLRAKGTFSTNGRKSRESATALEMAEDLNMKEIAALIRAHEANRVVTKP
jgi:ankyrin repeat protein